METIKREGLTAADLNWIKNIQQADSSSTVIHPLVVPPIVLMPTEQHLGTPAEPVVDVDDKVLKGQLIARANGLLSANIHAPTSGTVVAVAQRSINYDEAKRGTCIVIESDGLDEWIHREPCRDFQQVSSSILVNKIRDAGIVDLDGEGLPAHICLNPKKPINTLIISACQWNNAINADDVLLLKSAREIVIGLKIIRQLLDQPARTVIALEVGKDNVADAIHTAMEQEHLINCEVQLVRELDAGPDRQQLIETITGKRLNDDGLPLSVGCVCLNAATVYAIYRAVCLGEPQISQIITINGDGFNRRQTLSVPLGTPLSFILKQQGFQEDRGYTLRVNSLHTGHLLLREEAPVNKLVSSLWSTHSAHSIEAKQPQTVDYLQGLEFFDMQSVSIHSPNVNATNSLVATRALDITRPEARPGADESEQLADEAFQIEADELDAGVDIIDDADIPMLDQAIEDNFSLNIDRNSEAVPAEDIEDDLAFAKANSQFIEQAPAAAASVDNPNPDLTIRSHNILKLQYKLKNTEERLEKIDPTDQESAEALLLSINILIEKINAAKSLREKEDKGTANKDANNYTLRNYMGSLQERLALAQGALAKSDRAGANTQSAIKQALMQLEARLEDALASIHVD